MGGASALLIKRYRFSSGAEQVDEKCKCSLSFSAKGAKAAKMIKTLRPVRVFVLFVKIRVLRGPFYFVYLGQSTLCNNFSALR